MKLHFPIACLISVSMQKYSEQSVSEVFQEKENLACLCINYCKVCRFLPFGVTTHSNKEILGVVFIWSQETPRLD